MRLKKEQKLYVCSMGKTLRVTAIFTSMDEVNANRAKHRDEGLAAQFGQYLLVANRYHPGIPMPGG